MAMRHMDSKAPLRNPSVTEDKEDQVKCLPYRSVSLHSEASLFEYIGMKYLSVKVKFSCILL